ncbi:MAG: protein kinase [Thermoanaerobaculia bacterium]
MSESLRDLYDRLIEQPESERADFLARLETTDDNRAAQLRRLLNASESTTDSPLDRDPWSQLPADGVGAFDSATEMPQQIGPYRILSELGRGGMGRVYLAEQEGAGFRRKVALKVVAPEGAGVAEIDRRFRAEGGILAGLEHPGIARFYDAGRAEDGRWFLALEYVAGTDLLEHASDHALPLVERVRIFLAVLQAVAFAHAASIVHRDLKPANILVGADGRPRLLDFGIAKLVVAKSDVELSASMTTITGARALTPAYASPEQFRGETITPASDVFSLGVVFYELLAGVRPFEQQGSRGAVESAILGEDPEPPSTASRRVSTTGVRSSPPEGERPNAPVARVQRMPAGRFSRDLDAICLKALRKEPAERYPSAAEFAADVERFLTGQPVSARGGGLAYRAVRFYRRQRAAIAVAAALLLAIAMIAFAASARRLGTAIPNAAVQSDPTPQRFPFSGVAASEVPDLETRFTAEPGNVEVGAHLALSLDKAGRAPEAALIVTRLRQIPGKAEDPLIDYVEGMVALNASEPQRALVLLASAQARAIAGGRGELVSQIRASRGRLLSTLGRSSEAAVEMEAARAGFEASGDSSSLARVLNDLSIEKLQRGDLAGGETLLEQALAASRASGAGGGGVILGNLAGIAVQRGRPDLAEPRYRESVEIFREAKSRRLGWALTDRSETLRDLGRTGEAKAALDEAIELQTASGSAGDLALALSYRGAAELAAGETDRVEKTIAAIAALAKSSGDRPALAFVDRLRGGLAAARGDFQNAQTLLGEASRLLRENGQADWAAAIDLGMAESALDAKELALATTAAQSALATGGVASAEGTTAFVATTLLARAEIAAGKSRAAEKRLSGLTGSEPEHSPSLQRRFAFLVARAELGRAQGHAVESQRDFQSALDVAESAGLTLRARQIRRELALAGKSRPQGATEDQ